MLTDAVIPRNSTGAGHSVHRCKKFREICVIYTCETTNAHIRLPYLFLVADHTVHITTISNYCGHANLTKPPNRYGHGTITRHTTVNREECLPTINSSVGGRSLRRRMCIALHMGSWQQHLVCQEPMHYMSTRLSIMRESLITSQCALDNSGKNCNWSALVCNELSSKPRIYRLNGRTTF